MDVHRIERHDIDEPIATIHVETLSNPKYIKYWPLERIAMLPPAVNDIIHTSVRDEMRWAIAKGNRHYYGRSDIVLMNVAEPCTCNSCGDKHNANKQYAVYPSPRGKLEGDGVSRLSDVDRQWAEAESLQCWTAAQSDPYLMWWLFNGPVPDATR